MSKLYGFLLNKIFQTYIITCSMSLAQLAYEISNSRRVDQINVDPLMDAHPLYRFSPLYVAASPVTVPAYFMYKGAKHITREKD